MSVGEILQTVSATVLHRADASGCFTEDSMTNTAAFFADRRGRVDFAAFDRLMRRERGQAARAEDTIE